MIFRSLLCITFSLFLNSVFVLNTFAAAPTFTASIQAKDGTTDKILLTFSEAVSTTSGVSGQSVVAGDLTVGGTDGLTISSVSHVASSPYVVLTMSGNINLTGAGELTIACTATEIYDDGSTNACAQGATDIDSASIDTTGPTISNIHWLDNDSDGDIDKAEIQFNEPIDDSTVVNTDFEFDNDTTNDGTGEEAGSGGGTAVTSVATANLVDDAYYFITVTTGITGTDTANLHLVTTNTTDLLGNAIVAADNVGTDVDKALPVYTVTATSVHAGGDTVALNFTEAMDATTITNALLQADTNITLDYSDDAGNTNAANITVTNATVAWTGGDTVATITLDEGTDTAFIPSGKFIGVTLASVADPAGNNEAGSERYTATGVTAETTAPSVTKLGTGLIDYTISAGATANLVFNEILSSSAKTAVEAALTAGAGNAPSNYSWSGATLTITAHLTSDTKFLNDVNASASDLVGNSETLLLIDSLLEGGTGAPICNKPQVLSFSPRETQEVPSLKNFSFNVAPSKVSPAWKDVTWVKDRIAVTINNNEVDSAALSVESTNEVFTSRVKVSLPTALKEAGKANIVITIPGEPDEDYCILERIFPVNITGTPSSSEEKSSSSEATNQKTKSTQISGFDRSKIKRFENVVQRKKVFNDVAIQNWERPYVDKVSAAGIMTGYADGSGNFGKNDAVTNAQLLKVGLESFGFDIPTQVTEKPFEDVSTNEWFAPYIQKAKDLGVTPAIRAGQIGPNKQISRGETLRVLLELSGIDLENISDQSKFKDVSANKSFAKPIVWATQNNIVSGYQGGEYFGPYDSLTRGQLAKIVVNLLEFLGE